MSLPKYISISIIVLYVYNLYLRASCTTCIYLYLYVLVLTSTSAYHDVDIVTTIICIHTSVRYCNTISLRSVRLTYTRIALPTYLQKAHLLGVFAIMCNICSHICLLLYFAHLRTLVG